VYRPAIGIVTGHNSALGRQWVHNYRLARHCQLSLIDPLERFKAETALFTFGHARSRASFRPPPKRMHSRKATATGHTWKNTSLVGSIVPVWIDPSVAVSFRFA
jgi:hypothetical protein